MGIFIDAETVKAKTRMDEIKDMDTEDIELLLIRVAEARLEEAFDLDLDTDAEPRRWSRQFELYPGKLTEFQEDMKAALVILIDRMEVNPHGYATQSVRGSSVTFGKAMPLEVMALLRKWGSGGAKTGRIFRT
jgi:hypothetical protein